MNYEQYANKTRSVKSILAHASAKQRVKTFEVFSGDVYVRDVDFYVTNVSDGLNALVAQDSISLSANEFYFNPIEKKLYIHVSDSSDPKTRDIVLTYRIFLSDLPYNLPQNIISGVDVEYLPVIKSIGELKFELDYEQTGIAVESNSSITLENTHGFFDDIFDTLIFENQVIDFYSWSPQIPLSEAKKIYSGVVKDKSFSDKEIRLTLVDAIYQLRKPVQSSTFTEDDGRLDDSDLGKPKKRIYGRVQTMRTIGIDKVLDGFELSGTVTGVINQTSITGEQFLKQLSPQDQVKVLVNNTEYSYTIDTVVSDTVATITNEIEATFTAASVNIEPNVPYRFVNRLWHIAGHKLYEFTAVIDEVISNSRLRLSTVKNLLAGDILDINGQKRTIRRISGDQVVLTQVLSPVPDVDDVITKSPVYDVYYGNKKLVLDRDYTITNTTEAIIEIDPLAEFNIAPIKSVAISLTFTNSSRSVTTSADVDLKTLFKSRDWIRSNDITHQVWYEILTVAEKSITLRLVYAGSTAANQAKKKEPNYIEDGSLITVSCVGIERDGEWIKTPAEVVKDLTLNDAGLTNINQTSIDEAIEDCPYTVSYIIDNERKVRDCISDINKSCFGSLYQDESFNLSYKILNADKDEDLEALRDDDILGFSTKTKNTIINKVFASYRPFTDVFSGDDTFKLYEYDSDFVNQTSGIQEAREVKIFLYFDQDAENIAERVAFFNSLTQNVVTVRSKLNLSLKSLNDRMYIDLDRMFKRYGSANRRKIGIVNSITKNESSATVEFNDLAGVFTRVPAIAPNTLTQYDTSDEDDKAKFGYVLDNDSLLPDNDDTNLGNNLIG